MISKQNTKRKRIHRQNMQTPQKLKAREYDWNRIAAKQISFRVKQCKERQQSAMHQKSYILRKCIPDSPCSF